MMVLLSSISVRVTFPWASLSDKPITLHRYAVPAQPAPDYQDVAISAMVGDPVLLT